MTHFLSTPLDIGSTRLRNRILVAPMSGVSDLPFRRLAWQHGAGAVVSEMIAGEGLSNSSRKSRRRIRFGDIDVKIVQLAGRDPHFLAEAARICEGEGAAIVDFNMGCPAKKVTGGACGSALMRTPDHALRLIEAIVDAVSIPVTVKMRLGWDDDSRNAPEIATRAEQVGVKMITVHGRTRCQFYKGHADWAAIGAVKRRVSVPVIANGDVESAEQAAKIVEVSGADGVMIGRALYGRPWLAGQIAHALGAPAGELAPAASEMGHYVKAHYRAMVTYYGEAVAVRHARKHLKWYMERFASEVPMVDRQAILTSVDPQYVADRVVEIFSKNFNQTIRAA